MPLTTLGQETRWAYSTTLPSPHGATMMTMISVYGAREFRRPKRSAPASRIVHLSRRYFCSSGSRPVCPPNRRSSTSAAPMSPARHQLATVTDGLIVARQSRRCDVARRRHDVSSMARARGPTRTDKPPAPPQFRRLLYIYRMKRLLWNGDSLCAA